MAMQYLFEVAACNNAYIFFHPNDAVRSRWRSLRAPIWGLWVAFSRGRRVKVLHK